MQINKILLASILFSSIVITLRAQDSTGIKFENHLSWDSVLRKARSENKFIFVDCYATWCAPCKYMDQNIYPLKKVGDTYNSKFICVRMQMDQTLKDDSAIKKFYAVAKMIEQNYTVNVYPTFLFLDENGLPVHKVSGSKSEDEFIQLALDTENPDKQYYSILKNFQPGKLDTAEEKGLARSFGSSGKELAGKIALDYLRRIPESQLNLFDNGHLMAEFQDNASVLDIAIGYIQKTGVSDNREFVLSLRGQPRIKTLANNYITSLDDLAFGQEINLKFTENFSKEPAVQTRVKAYISNLPQDSLYTPKVIELLNTFTESPDDPGFAFFYQHPARVNAVMKNKDYAQGIVRYVINKSEFVPSFNAAKQTGVLNFDLVASIIKQKYDSSYTDDVIINGKVSWYNFLVNSKKETQYWPQLIDSRIAKIRRFRLDTLSGSAQTMVTNNAAFDIFLRSNNKEELSIALKWMQLISEKYRDDSYCQDTYACILYKLGKVSKAIKTENYALKIAINLDDKENIKLYTVTIREMKNGDKIWYDKERFEN